MTIAMLILAILFVFFASVTVVLVALEQIGATDFDLAVPGIAALTMSLLTGLALSVLAVVNFGIGG